MALSGPLGQDPRYPYPLPIIALLDLIYTIHHCSTALHRPSSPLLALCVIRALVLILVLGGSRRWRPRGGWIGAISIASLGSVVWEGCKGQSVGRGREVYAYRQAINACANAIFENEMDADVIPAQTVEQHIFFLAGVIVHEMMHSLRYIIVSIEETQARYLLTASSAHFIQRHRNSEGIGQGTTSSRGPMKVALLGSVARGVSIWSPCFLAGICSCAMLWLPPTIPRNLRNSSSLVDYPDDRSRITS